ncbi:DUF317 domain-containing protein [Streptomyces sp. NPDC051976]|uniref:DUF317 domain-containing protein n=1 Tax=Streptomyces sp. NPDC051976 TaxID=3154947 RepID=UPI0034255B11
MVRAGIGRRADAAVGDGSANSPSGSKPSSPNRCPRAAPACSLWPPTPPSAYLSQSRHGGWKITRRHEPLGIPVWLASFGRDTPTEITTAFTHALIAYLASDRKDPWWLGSDGPPVSASVGRPWLRAADFEEGLLARQRKSGPDLNWTISPRNIIIR